MNNFSTAAILLTLSAPCMAQSTHMYMPEGSKDVYLSLAAGNTRDSDGSGRRNTFIVPLVSAQFANGVFINLNTVGMHLSHTPGMDYGVQLAPTISRRNTRTANGWESEKKFTPEAGAFFNYGIAHGLAAHSELMYGGSSDRRGLRLRFGASMWLPIAEHHHLGIETEVRLANRSSLQSTFGVTTDQAGPGLPLYQVASGVRDTGISALWRWHFSNKYTLTTRLMYSRLHGSAAASPRVESAGGAGALTVLTYRY